jgi:hypothetical protein
MAEIRSQRSAKGREQGVNSEARGKMSDFELWISNFGLLGFDR